MMIYRTGELNTGQLPIGMGGTQQTFHTVKIHAAQFQHNKGYYW